MSRLHAALWGAVLLSGAGCNRYAMLRVAGYLTPNHPQDADILFVIDGSGSMAEESVALAESMSSFAEELQRIEGETGLDGLDHAVEDYIDQIADRGAYIDFQIALTSSDAAEVRGALLGDALIPRDDPALATSINRQLLCEASCFEGLELPSDPGYACTDPPAPLGTVSVEALTCLCGPDVLARPCASRREQPLDAVALAMCRAVPDPPAACYDLPFSDTDILANDGLLREGTVFVPIVITDEGDMSSRLSPVDTWPDPYLRLLGRFDHDIVWAVVAPALDEERRVVCDTSNATSWGVQRLEYMAELSGGRRESIHDDACRPAGYGEVLARIGDLILGRGAAFPLYGPADPDTIRVFINGERVPPAPDYGLDAFGAPRLGDGWTYDADQRQILLHGSWIPEPSDEVEIYYRPV